MTNICLKTLQKHRASPWPQAPPHQSVLADDEEALGAAQLRQPDLLVESAVAPHHHGDAVREAPLRDVGGGAQHGRGQVMNLEAGLRQRASATRFLIFWTKDLEVLTPKKRKTLQNRSRASERTEKTSEAFSYGVKY